jgi:alcohol dehydrogenase YqhD (iron-dependent ADH family)
MTEKLGILCKRAKILLAYGGGSIFTENGIHEQINVKDTEIVEFSGIEANHILRL